MAATPETLLPARPIHRVAKFLPEIQTQKFARDAGAGPPLSRLKTEH